MATGRKPLSQLPRMRGRARACGGHVGRPPGRRCTGGREKAGVVRWRMTLLPFLACRQQGQGPPFRSAFHRGRRQHHRRLQPRGTARSPCPGWRSHTLAANAGLEPRHSTGSIGDGGRTLPLRPGACGANSYAPATRAPGNIPISPGIRGRRPVAVARQCKARLLLAWRLLHRHRTAAASARTSSGPIRERDVTVPASPEAPTVCRPKPTSARSEACSRTVNRAV